MYEEEPSNVFWNLLQSVYTFPFTIKSYDGTRDGMDWFLTIFSGLIIYGLTILALCGVIALINNRFRWYTRRKRCQHENCNHAWTLDTSELTSDPVCRAAQPCCPSCQERHRAEKLHREANTEQRYSCPRCRTAMDKVISENIIRDVCPKCEFVLLDMEELHTIEQIMYDRGYENGEDSGKSTGLAIGIATGIAI